MFSVIISEKGGTERREAFDRAEVNVGRVVGNELMLPKGNVSKRHARLLCRDGRFIVTDLKSTNGTYVNGRKIAQATIVREGDKIYIGDFILRIDAGAGRSPSQTPPAPAPVILADDSPSDLQPAPPPHNAAESDGNGLRMPVSPALSEPAVAGALTAPPGPLSSGDPPKPPLADPVETGARPVGGDPQTPAGAVSLGGAPKPPAPMVPQVAAAATGNPEPPKAMEGPSSSEPSSSSGLRNLRALAAPVIENKPLDDSIAPKPPRADHYHDVISHFPLEHDPDESLHFAVPAPPKVPSAAKPLLGKTMPAPTGAPEQRVGRVGDPQTPTRGGSFVPGSRVPGPTAPGTPFNLPAPPLVPSPPREAVLPPPLGAERPTSPSIGLAALGVLQSSGTKRPPDSPPAVHFPRSIANEATPSREGSTRARLSNLGHDPAAHAARRAAFVWLVGRVHELVDLNGAASFPEDAQVRQVDQALAEAAPTLADRTDVNVEEIVAAARREICDLGALTRVFEDDEVTEVQVLRHDHVVPLHGRRALPLDLGFSSDEAVGRAVRRLCIATGKPVAPGETFVDRRLARGARLFAMLPGPRADAGHVVVVRKPVRADASLEEMVRSGTISRAIATFLGQCVAARASILIAGPVGAGGSSLLGALAGAGSTDDRVVVLQKDDEIVLDHPHAVSILLGETAEEAVRAVRAAARLVPDRLVVGALGGAIAADVADAISDGLDGVIAAAQAPSLRHAVMRLTADIAASRPGVSPDVAREQLVSMFDVAIEIARLRDGRLRVLRIAELDVEAGRAAIRDVFTFTIERTAAGGAVEGTFAPTEVVPRIAMDLEARGTTVDSSLFRRHVKGDSGDDLGARVKPPSRS